MPRRLLMSDVVTRVLQAANRENDDSIGTVEKKSRISLVYGSDLYETVCDAGHRYFEYEQSFTTAGLGYIAEPADHLATVDNIELVLDATTGRCCRLKPITPQERAAWSGRTGTPRRYAMIDDRFYLYPTPPSGTRLTLRYIPQPPDLSTFADSDVVDVVTPSGEGLLIWGSACSFLSKSSSDLAFAMSERERFKAQLADWAAKRAFNEPQRTYVDDDDDDLYYDGDWRNYR